jgi:hypothetical protein
VTGARCAVALLLVALAVLAGACSQDDGDDLDGGAATTTSTTGPGDRAGDAGDAGDGTELGGWEQVRAPATCRCSDGSPYHFWVRRGDPERLLFYLEGGGACFSAETCGTEPTFVPTLPEGGDDPGIGGQQGIFDLTDERNPFADFSIVFVPYCTGDLHLGDTVHDYGDGVVVNHNGAVNGQTALAAAAATFPDAREVVVAGSSAGSASAPLYGGLAHDVLPDARITVIADGSAAYPGDATITTAIGSLWGSFEHLPSWPSSAGEPNGAWSLPGLFVRADRHVPGIRMATINNAYDEVQARFSALIGSHGDLREKILANEERIEGEGVEVRGWLTPGTEHTILGRAELYGTAVGGTALHEWLADLVAGEDVPDVRCTDCR